MIKIQTKILKKLIDCSTKSAQKKQYYQSYFRKCIQILPHLLLHDRFPPILKTVLQHRRVFPRQRLTHLLTAEYLLIHTKQQLLIRYNGEQQIDLVLLPEILKRARLDLPLHHYVPLYLVHRIYEQRL
jgi:hypothetical protein